MQDFIYKTRVYWDDTDAGGVVYHTNYLKWAEHARSDMLRQIGFSQTQLLQELNIAFVVKQLTLDYFVPALLDDLICIYSKPKTINGAKIIMQQNITRDGIKLATLNLTLACVSTTKKATRIPSKIACLIGPYCSHQKPK